VTRKQYAELAARTRVPLGFAMLALYAVYARPSLPRFVAGAAVAALGLALRALATGHLDKNRSLATNGPYAYTRNPLYLGTALAACGFALAGGCWWLAVLFALFLMLWYLPVVGEEESHLANLFPEFREYSARVPRFWPLLRPRAESSASPHFRWALYRQNQEYNALVGYLFGLALLVWKLFAV
jgi:protein-S-isoprenylcysteine O-methyltransferase Ste14